ncbi:MAG: M66 family metalloprotease [Fibrobacterales bacterium]
MNSNNIKLIVYMLVLSVPNIFAQSFNTNNLPSDTEGDLLGTVLFAQHAVIPSKNTIPNDIQPHVTQLRKTMVLFKPQAKIPESPAEVTLVVGNKNSDVAETFTMRSPDALTTLPGVVKSIDLSTIDFTAPPSFDYSISGQTALNTLKDDISGSQVASHLASHNTLSITLADGAWINAVYLPDKTDLTNKTVVISSTAGYGATLYYRNTSVSMTKGTTIVAKLNEGTWYIEDDESSSTLTYGEGFWSAIVPLEYILPGMILTITHEDLTGTLDDINIGGYSELILHTIDIGMLTPNQDVFQFQKDEELQRQYFQTLPVSRFIVNNYESIHLTEVMLPDGTLLTGHDHTSEGGIYEGSMRGAIGKLLISHGINNANYGINTSSATSESTHPYWSAQITAHNSIGNYTNGVQVHGLSGGNGMVTLKNSVGNEFSHELGHNYGLGHYPGDFDGCVHRPADAINSTWGWDSDADLFIPNFALNKSDQQTCYNESCVEPFNGYTFGKDAMGGGAPHIASVNNYTLYTPYTASIIQSFFESKVNFSDTSSTGFIQWDADAEAMVPWELSVPLYTGSQRVFAKPSAFGVPVTTLLGFYDPNATLPSYIYPALHSGYGMVYQLVDATTSEAVCELTVDIKKGETLHFPLYSERITSGNMNKFHVNVESALEPQTATVACNDTPLVSRSLSGPSQVHSYSQYGYNPDDTIPTTGASSSSLIDRESSVDGDRESSEVSSSSSSSSSLTSSFDELLSSVSLSQDTHTSSVTASGVSSSQITAPMGESILEKSRFHRQLIYVQSNQVSQTIYFPEHATHFVVYSLDGSVVESGLVPSSHAISIEAVTTSGVLLVESLHL